MDLQLLPSLGTVGLLAIEASYLPQIFRLWRLKEADDVSLFFPGLNLVGRVLVVMYAASVGDALFTAGFALSIALRSALLLQVLYYRFVRPRWVRPRFAPAAEPLPRSIEDWRTT